MFFRILAIGCAALIAASGDAKAATTVYPVSVFQNLGVAQPSRLIGNTPTTSARFGRSDSVGVNYGTDISHFALSIEITQLQPRTTWLTVQVGRFVAGVFTPAVIPGLLDPLGAATNLLFVPVTQTGTIYVNTLVFDSACQTLGGCNAARLGNSTFSQPGARFDVSTVGATPESDAWALMIVAFAGLAWRLKRARRSTQGLAALDAPALR